MKRTLTLLSLFITLNAAAQGGLDTLKNDMASLKKSLAWLKGFKITGYIQPQFQLTDTAGAKGVAAGNFPASSNNRFTIRRGRLKPQYELPGKKGGQRLFLQFEVDFTERGVQLMECYGRFFEPMTNWFGLQLGLYKRPMSYEMQISSGVRETPERWRAGQTIFPSERDMGASFIIEPPKLSKFAFFRAEVAVMNGTGLLDNTKTFNVGFSGDNDKKKEIVGRLGLFKNLLKDDALHLSAQGGYYRGSLIHQTPNSYAWGEVDSFGTQGFVKTTDSSAINERWSKREYISADFQISYHYKLGSTEFRTEYLGGTQPGGSTFSQSQKGNPQVADIYSRQFNAWMMYLTQRFVDKQKHVYELVFKYDFYDPNTKVKGQQLVKETHPDATTTTATGLTSTDVKYETFSFGFNFHYDEHWKLMIYYDLVRNEKAALSDFNRDLKDNVLTIRTQFKF